MPSFSRHFSLIVSHLIIALLITSSASAQRIDSAFGELVPFGQLQVSLDGKVLEGTKMYLSEKAGAYLIVSPGLEQPLLVNARTQSVQRVSTDKVYESEKGTANLLLGAVTETIGPFTVAGTEVSASLGQGHKLTLGPKPYLLGPQTAEEILSHDVSYGYRARQYPPSEANLAALRKESRKVTVKVYFGSWCGTCAKMLPWVIQVEQDLEGSNINFEYYGLPGDMKDPVVEKMSIKGVPTAVVFIDGKEVGRKSAPDIGVPEKALLDVLSKSDP